MAKNKWTGRCEICLSLKKIPKSNPHKRGGKPTFTQVSLNCHHFTPSYTKSFFFLFFPIYSQHISSSQLQFPEVSVGCRGQVSGWRELSATDSISLLWLMAQRSARNWWAWESTYVFFLIRKEQIPGSPAEHMNIKESKTARPAKSQRCGGEPKLPSRTQWNQENLMLFSTSA